MRRRDFIAGIAGSAAGWPLAARAQRPAIPVVGFIRSTSETGSRYLVAAFRQGLKEGGFGDRDVIIEYRWGDDRNDRMPALAAGLVAQSVDVIVGNTPASLAAKAATKDIPIVFITGGDPSSEGLVKNFNHPEGNLTGFVFFFGQLGTKRLQIIRQMTQARAIGMVANLGSPNTDREHADVQAAARTIGQELVVLNVNSGRDIETAFEKLVERRVGALFTGSGAFLNSNRERVVALAARHRLPTMYAQREAVLAGGLMSYGPSISDAHRRAGIYTARILKGEKPSDLPVVQSTKFDFVLNLKTAKALGLEVPPTLLALPDEVIE